jgi:hypothetical protein
MKPMNDPAASMDPSEDIPAGTNKKSPGQSRGKIPNFRGPELICCSVIYATNIVGFQGYDNLSLPSRET